MVGRKPMLCRGATEALRPTNAARLAGFPGTGWTQGQPLTTEGAAQFAPHRFLDGVGLLRISPSAPGNHGPDDDGIAAAQNTHFRQDPLRVWAPIRRWEKLVRYPTSLATSTGKDSGGPIVGPQGDGGCP